MPQEFQVLQCFSCKTFQVHQVKKVLKWNCKMCGQKQSIKKVFGCGSGADCRRHVQKCNMTQGDMCESSLTHINTTTYSVTSHKSLDPVNSRYEGVCENSRAQMPATSKWNSYLESSDDKLDDPSDDDEQLTTNRREFTRAIKSSKNVKREYRRTEPYHSNTKDTRDKEYSTTCNKESQQIQSAESESYDRNVMQLPKNNRHHLLNERNLNFLTEHTNPSCTSKNLNEEHVLEESIASTSSRVARPLEINAPKSSKWSKYT